MLKMVHYGVMRCGIRVATYVCTWFIFCSLLLMFDWSSIPFLYCFETSSSPGLSFDQAEVVVTFSRPMEPGIVGSSPTRIIL